MGAHHQFLLPGMDRQVVDGGGGQLVVELHEGGAPVEGDVEGVVGADVEEVRVFRVFSDDVDGFQGQIRADGGPVLAVVFRDVEVGREVIPAIAVEGGVDAALLVAGGLYAAHPQVFRQAAADVLPAETAVVAEMQQAIVGAGIEQAELQGRLVDGCQGAEGHVSLLAALSQVFGNFFKVLALVEGSEQFIGAHVEDVRVVGRQVDGDLPVPAVGALAQVWLGGDVFPLVSVGVDAEVVAELVAGVNGFVIARVDGHLHAVAALNGTVGVLAGIVPVGAGLVSAGAHPYAIVLQAAIDAIGVRHIDGNGVELPYGGRVALDPAFAVVIGDVYPAVVAQDEVAGAVGVDPEGVVVAVYVVAVDVFPGLAAIVRAQDRHAHCE